MLGVNSPILHEPQIPQRCPTPGGKTERIPHVTPKHEWGPGLIRIARSTCPFPFP